MTALLLHKLRLLIESDASPDAKTLRDCTAVLKELTALTRDLAPAQTEDAPTGVILLPEVKEEHGRERAPKGFPLEGEAVAGGD